MLSRDTYFTGSPPEPWSKLLFSRSIPAVGETVVVSIYPRAYPLHSNSALMLLLRLLPIAFIRTRGSGPHLGRLRWNKREVAIYHMLFIVRNKE
jgi:hypothetical protein